MKKKKARQEKKDPFKSLAQCLARDRQRMKELYSRDNFKGLARLLAERHAVLITPDYRRIQGARSANLWRKASEKKAQLEFRLANTFLGNALGQVSVRGRKYDLVAFVIHEVHLIGKTGKSGQNETLYMETNYAHQGVCPWF